MHGDMESWVYVLNIAGVIIGLASVIWGLFKRKRETLLFAGITSGIIQRIFPQESVSSVVALILAILLLMGYFISGRTKKNMESTDV